VGEGSDALDTHVGGILSVDCQLREFLRHSERIFGR
jgi:hypothetical protein